jgi:cell shape-determining protein MreC
MGLFTLLLIVIVILAVIALGRKSFTSRIISGFETVLDVGQPIVKNLTQEAREYVNSVNMIMKIIPLTFWH